MERLNRLTDEELIYNFTSVTRDLGAAVLDSEDDLASASIDQLWTICDLLRARGNGSIMKLEPLLNAKDRFVRYYAAKQLIGFVPERAREIIEWNAKYGFDAIAGDAAMTLINLERGFYKPSN